GGAVRDAGVAVGGDAVALRQRAAYEHALERLGRTVETHLALRRGEDHPGGGARFGAADLHVLARGGAGVGAFEAVEADHRERLVLAVGREGQRGGDALALDLDDVAFGDAERLEGRARDARDAPAAFFLARRSDLQPDRALFHFCRARVRHSPLS